MPSPFPGMDPWLEHPFLFPDVHDSFVTYLRDALNAVLPAPYVAALRARIWLEKAQRPIGPDVEVVRDEGDDADDEIVVGNGGTAVAQLVATKPVVIRVVDEEFHEGFVDILKQADAEEQVVTTIELLSMSNKSPGEQGRDMYRKKQRDILNSKVHLVEIDLLRGGQHSTIPPRWRIKKKVGLFDYHVSIHHFDKLELYFVYAWQLAARLPTIAVPLLPGDGEVTVDLQTVLDKCYELGHYERRARYKTRAMDPPLTPAQLEWVQSILRAKAVI